jgi:hypothetical protein
MIKHPPRDKVMIPHYELRENRAETLEREKLAEELFSIPREHFTPLSRISKLFCFPFSHVNGALEAFPSQKI